MDDRLGYRNAQVSFLVSELMAVRALELRQFELIVLTTLLGPGACPWCWLESSSAYDARCRVLERYWACQSLSDFVC